LRRTNLLIIICTLISLVYWYTYSSFVEDYLVYNGNRLAQGFLWTPITTLFVHSDWVHLIGNMVFLYVFGNVIEKEAGAKMTMTAFLIGGVGPLIISSFYYGLDAAMIGASGAIFTLSAVAMLTKPLKLSFFFLFIPIGLVAILYFLFNVVAVSLGFGGNVGYVAHIAGFLIGIPFGIASSKVRCMKNLGITILLLVAFLATVYAVQFLLKLS